MARIAGRARRPDLKALEAFAALGDRRSSPFFAGRKDRMDAVERLCAEALAVARKGEAMGGATQLIQGAPGAGKTALLSEMARRWTNGESPHGAAAPVPVTVFPGELADEATVAAKIARAIDPDADEAWRQTETRNVTGHAGVPGIAGASGSRRTAMAPPAPSFEELRRRFPPQSWTRPVCLAVDEVQTVREAATDVLVKLHSGMPGLPIVPVLAGLANSQDVVSGCGLSRLEVEAVHTLGALAPEEARDAVEAMLERCRVSRTGSAEDWPALLSGRSDGWPQHLHNAMRALAVELVRTEGKLAAVDTAAVLDREQRFRETAYLARISPQMEGARRLVAAVLTALPEGGARRDDIEAEIERQCRTRSDGDPDSRARQLPDGMNGEAFFAHLVHRGALQRGFRARYLCPIPSFRRFLVEFGTDEDREPPGP